jgi:geranylgeranyl diphosphate synthase, type I
VSKPTVLARAGALVEPELRKAVATLDAHLRTPAEYHFGWVEIDGTPTSGSGGKGVRPALAVLGAEAVGAEAAVAAPGAVALELIHNFSLIHDDIMDGDRTRRHRRTVWDVYGVGDAILVGDALHTLAFQVLLDDSTPQHLTATHRLGLAVAAIITGQAQDTALDRAPDATLAGCLVMAGNKTGALLAQSVAIGAVLGGADLETANALERFGAELGLSFQAVDDVLGIWGDPETTGKPVGNDLRMRKKSMPVAMAFDDGGALGKELRTAFAAEHVSDDDVARLSRHLDAAGIRSRVLDVARAHLDAALTALASRPLRDAAAAELADLAHFVVERNY